MTENDVTWREVPQEALEKARRRGQAYAYEAERMRANPGKSMILKPFGLHESDSARQLTNAVKSGRLAAFRPGGAFDAVTHTEDGTVNVYAWFVAREPDADGG